jgi:hypothetical protein
MNHDSPDRHSVQKSKLGMFGERDSEGLPGNKREDWIDLMYLDFGLSFFIIRV